MTHNSCVTLLLLPSFFEDEVTETQLHPLRLPLFPLCCNNPCTIAQGFCLPGCPLPKLPRACILSTWYTNNNFLLLRSWIYFIKTFIFRQNTLIVMIYSLLRHCNNVWHIVELRFWLNEWINYMRCKGRYFKEEFHVCMKKKTIWRAEKTKMEAGVL